MPVLTDLASAEVKRNVKRLFGTVRSRPALLVSDGVNSQYACEVDIGEHDVTGIIDQYKKMLLGLPDDDPDTHFNLDNEALINTTLHNVLIARNNRDLIYADIGNPVIVERSADGNWQVTGFAIERAETHTLIPVHLGDMTIGSIIDLSVTSHLLTFGELGTLSPFGNLPFGASGLFVGGTLMKVI